MLLFSTSASRVCSRLPAPEGVGAVVGSSAFYLPDMDALGARGWGLDRQRHGFRSRVGYLYEIRSTPMWAAQKLKARTLFPAPISRIDARPLLTIMKCFSSLNFASRMHHLPFLMCASQGAALFYLLDMATVALIFLQST